MKKVLPETPQPSVQEFESRDRITTPPSVDEKRRLLESLSSTSADVESVYESTPIKPKFEIEFDHQQEENADAVE